MGEWKTTDEAPLNTWALVTDGDDIDIAIMYEASRSYWEQVDETTKRLQTTTSRWWHQRGDDYMDVKYWMPLPELPPKPPEDPDKVRERALLGI